MKIGLLLSPKIEANDPIVPEIIELLIENKQTVIVADWQSNSLSTHLNGVERCNPEQMPEKIDALFSIGGDGTFLSASHLMAKSRKPVLGIHLGGLGFLADVSVDNYRERLIDFLNGKFWVEDGQGLRAGPYFKDSIRKSFAFTNLLVTKGGTPRRFRIGTIITKNI